MSKMTEIRENITRVVVYRGTKVSPDEDITISDQNTGIVVAKCTTVKAEGGVECNTSLSTSASMYQMLGIINGLISDLAEKGDMQALLMLRRDIDAYLTKDPGALMAMLQEAVGNMDDGEDEEHDDAECLEEPMMLPFGGEELEDDLT